MPMLTTNKNQTTEWNSFQVNQNKERKEKWNMKGKFQHNLAQADSNPRLLHERIRYNLIEGARVDGQNQKFVL
jgi:hypothetical protein